MLVAITFALFGFCTFPALFLVPASAHVSHHHDSNEIATWGHIPNFSETCSHLFLFLPPKPCVLRCANISYPHDRNEVQLRTNQTPIPSVNILSFNTSRGELPDQADCP